MAANADTPDSGDVNLQTTGSKRTTRAAKVNVTANFIRSSTGSQEGSVQRWDWLRYWMNSLYFANFMGLVMVLDACCTSALIDAHAAKRRPEQLLSLASDACLIMYTLELVVYLTISDCSSRLEFTMMVDLGIVLCGWAERIIEATSSGLGFRIAVLRPLRLVRIFRLLRSLKRMRMLKELHKLAVMMATCLRTLLWSFLLCFVVMTVWAMLMVELVHPAVQQMNEQYGSFDDCEQCQKAMSTVMHANLLLFKTVIAGDSWGEIAVPVIQEHPATAIIFLGSLLSLVFGVLNLIVAVVVDTFAEARSNDVQALAEEMELDIEHDRKLLAQLFRRIDHDGSGQLTLEELIRGARRDPQFHSRLRVMDIDEDDLEQLFYMIDQDNSGTVEVEEFIGPLSRWAHDSKTAPRFIKYNMLQTMQLQQDLYDLSVECFQQLEGRMDQLAMQREPPEQPKASQVTELQTELQPDTESLEATLEMQMKKLEQKLDMMLQDRYRRISPPSPPLSPPYSALLSPALSNGGQDEPVKPLRRRRDVFRNMYMRRGHAPAEAPVSEEGSQSLGLLGMSLGMSRPMKINSKNSGWRTAPQTSSMTTSARRSRPSTTSRRPPPRERAMDL